MITRIKKVSIYSSDCHTPEEIEIKNECNATLIDNVLNFVFSYKNYNEEVRDLAGTILWVKHLIKDKKIKRIYILTTEDTLIDLTSNYYLLEETENPLYFSIILHNNLD